MSPNNLMSPNNMASPWLGLAVTLGFALITLTIAIWMLATGYKLRS